MSVFQWVKTDFSISTMCQRHLAAFFKLFLSYTIDITCIVFNRFPWYKKVDDNIFTYVLNKKKNLQKRLWRLGGMRLKNAKDKDNVEPLLHLLFWQRLSSCPFRKTNVFCKILLLISNFQAINTSFVRYIYF